MRHAALIRAVNVGGRKVTMAELRQAAEALGFAEIKTLLASGNLVFETKAAPAGELEHNLETAITNKFGLVSEVMVRDPKQWAAIINANPFPEKAKYDPAHLVCMVCKDKPDAAAITTYLKTLREKHDNGEQLKIIGREIFIDYGPSIGQSKLSLPKKVATGTTRNWNTMLKLGAMLGI